MNRKSVDFFLQKLGGKAHGFNRGMKAKKFIFLHLCVYFS